MQPLPPALTIYFLFGQFLPKVVDGQDNQGCDVCWLCDETALLTTWFVEEMHCVGIACYIYHVLPEHRRDDATPLSEQCSYLEEFSKCRYKDNSDKCDCIIEVCAGPATFRGPLVSCYTGLTLLMLQVVIRF